MEIVDKETKTKETRKAKIVVIYDLDLDEILIQSEFLDAEKFNFKDPIGYTAQCLQMALVKWIRTKIGLKCPECDVDMNESWDYCPNCGWTWKGEISEKV